MNRSVVRSTNVWVGVLAAVLATSAVAGAQAVDAGAAREQLKQGFALKQQAKFAEALPHLLESLRLDPQVKTLMNLADTEEHLGKLVDASRHWIAARDKAASAGDDAARGEIVKRLAACEARMPKLTIVVKGADASAITVKRDAVVLGAVSLGVALPADPGAHVVLVEAPGFESRTFEVTLAEGEARTTEVSPGPKVSATVDVPPPVTTAPPAVTSAPRAAPRATSAAPSAPSAPSAPPPSTSPLARPPVIAGIATFGVGVVLIAVGGVEYASAKSKHDDALTRCPANKCDAQALSLQSDAKSAVKAGNAFAITGAVLAVAGGALAAVSLRKPAETTGTVVAPVMSPNGGGVVWNGVF